MRTAPSSRFFLAALSLLAIMGTARVADASEDRYRLELIVFRNTGVAAAPVETRMPRGFGDAFELRETAMPEDPVPVDTQDGTFTDIWNRLERLADYEPLLRLTYEQSAFEFQPPVRVHDDEVLAETGPREDEAEPRTEDRLFRLDGAVHLRRSRFLHVDLDLEYRLDGPAWQREFGLPPGFEWIGGAPAEARDLVPGPAPEARQPAPINALQPMTEAGPVVTDGSAGQAAAPLEEPFQVHRLQQSRQVLTNTFQYFDSAFLGAIVRVTEITDEDT